MVMNISSPSFSPAVVVSFLIMQVRPLIQADADDQLYFTAITPVIFGCINYTHTYVGLGLQFPKRLLGDFPGLASPNDISIFIETAIVVVISFVLLLQVNSSYVWLAVFPIIAIGFILVLSNELSRQNGSQQQRGAGDLGSGKEMKKAEEEEHDGGEATSSGSGTGTGSGGDPGTEKKEMKRAEGLEIATLVVYLVLCIMGQFHSAANFAVSLFLLFLTFTLGALTRMMTKLSLTRTAAPGAAPASALLWKASLVVLLVAVHAVAVELLGEQVVLFILPELAPLLLWLSVHVDRAKEGAVAVITADHITFTRNLGGALAVVVLACACLAVAMDESIFSWVAKAVVSCAVSGLLVCYLVFMISQWGKGGQDAKAAAPFLEETVKLLKVWAKVLFITAIALLVTASVAALRLDLHAHMLAAPAQSFNKYVTSSSTL